MIDHINGSQRVIDLEKLNIVEQNAILYYADFLSLRQCSKTVTDNCKYFFIKGAPMNSLYLLDMKPHYNNTNIYLAQAYDEYMLLRDKFDVSGVQSFIEDICSLKAKGCIDSVDMMKQIHLYDTTHERRKAFREYYKHRSSYEYTHTINNEDGKRLEVPCTRYFAHAEERATELNLPKNLGANIESTEEDFE